MRFAAIREKAAPNSPERMLLPASLRIMYHTAKASSAGAYPDCSSLPGAAKINMIGFAMTGSFCTHQKALGILEKLTADTEVLPVVSECVYTTDTRFGTAADLLKQLQALCGREPVHTIRDAEPLGPKIALDVLLICPCTGNTLAKIAAGITDTPVTMAAKAHLRCDRPLVLALCSNDALAANLKNIGTLMEKKSVFFVPMRQDDPVKKPHSLVADFTRVFDTLKLAAEGKQLRPVFLP